MNSVLVVEDNHELRTLIERMLALRGYDVRCAATLAEATTALDELPSLCLVLWDPITLPLSTPIVALAARLGVHIATIPIGITSTGQTPDGSILITKRLTSVDALFNVLKEHCPGVAEPATV